MLIKARGLNFIFNQNIFYIYLRLKLEKVS